MKHKHGKATVTNRKKKRTATTTLTFDRLYEHDKHLKDNETK